MSFAVLEICEEALVGTAAEAWWMRIKAGADQEKVSPWMVRICGAQLDEDYHGAVMGPGWFALSCFSVAEAEWLAKHMVERRGVPESALHLRVIPMPPRWPDRDDNPDQEALPIGGGS